MMRETKTACPRCGGSGVAFRTEKIVGGYRGEVDGCPVCRGTGQVPVTITHGDAIRAMDGLALALWMLELIKEPGVPRYCRSLPECDRDLDEDREIPLERCRECLALWLGQAEGGGQDGQQTG